MKRIRPPGYSRNATEVRIRYCKNHRPEVSGENNHSRNRSTKEELIIRRSIVVQLRSKGVSVVEIAESFGVNVNTIFKDLKTALDPEVKYSLKNSDVLRQLELTRLDQALEKLWPKVEKASFGAIDLLLKMMKRRSAFLGLDSDHKVGIVNEPLPWTDDEEPVPWGMGIPDRPVDTEADGV